MWGQCQGCRSWSLPWQVPCLALAGPLIEHLLPLTQFSKVLQPCCSPGPSIQGCLCPPLTLQVLPPLAAPLGAGGP